MFADYKCNTGYGDFGRNWFSPVTNIASRVVRTVRDSGRALSKGNIIKAVSIMSPVSIVARAVTDNKRLQNYAMISSPISVGAISDYKLRKKAAIGYAAAAAVAVTIYALPTASGAAKPEVFGPPAPPTTPISPYASLLADAKKVGDAASAANAIKGVIIGGKAGPEVEENQQERAMPGTYEDRYEKEMKDTNYMMYGGIALGVITLGGLIYYFATKSKEA